MSAIRTDGSKGKVAGKQEGRKGEVSPVCSLTEIVFGVSSTYMRHDMDLTTLFELGENVVFSGLVLTFISQTEEL